MTLAGAGTALLAIPGMAFMAASYTEAAKGLILNELDYLKPEKAGVEQFVQEYALSMTPNFPIKIRSLYMVRASASQSKLVNDMVQDYLLSTDFFRNRMDEQKPLKYLGLYNPYKTPCANPFSNLYYPPQVS